jgi:RNA ligase (TIGR02306 family)
MATKIIVSVFEIEEILPHKNADSLEIIRPLGWQVVTRKGTWKVGQKCIYIPPDAIVPDNLAEKWGVKQYLLGPNKDRVGKIKLRSEPSFGFIAEADDIFDVGDNVAEYYGIEKYEPPIVMSMEDAEKEDPLFEKYTDIENLRNYPNVFEKDEEIIVTEKIHGCNSRIAIIGEEKMAGSMRLRRKMPETIENGNVFWFPWTIEKVNNLIYSLKNKLTANRIIFYGEIYGGSVQSLDYGVAKGKGFGYRIFDILVDDKYLEYDKIFEYLKEFNIEDVFVPILYRGKFDINKIKELSDGKSTIASHIREGVVVRPVIERTHPKVGRLVMKYISDSYLFSKNSDFKDV